MAHTAPPGSDRVSGPVVFAFVAYFAAILPLLVWGLWALIDRNTLAIPGTAVLNGLSPTWTTLADSVAFVQANQQTRLLLDQGEMMLAVVLAGGIGSYIHGVNSFVSYVGNRSFVASWVPWYLLRPFMGVAMAVIFYVVVRGGVLVMSGGVSAVDPYAMMTVAALAGMFSKQASDKLAEVFDTLFRSRADQERADKLELPELKLAAVNPAEVVAGSKNVVITATGTGFVAASVVKFDNTDRKPTFKSATELTFTLLDADVAAAGEHTVAIFNPGGQGTTSNELKLTVVPAPTGAGVGTTVQVPAVITANEDGELEVVSVAEDAGSGTSLGATTATDASGGTTTEAEASGEETTSEEDEEVPTSTGAPGAVG